MPTKQRNYMKPDNLIKNETMIVIPPTLNLRGTGYHHGGHLFNRTGHVLKGLKQKQNGKLINITN